MLKFSTYEGALAWMLKSLSKTERHEVMNIKNESVLDSFIKKHDICCDCKDLFKATIPVLPELLKYINKVDNETNIYDVLFDTNGTYVKKLRNVANFDQTMKNFYRAPMFVQFKLGTDKLIALRLNENWMSPGLDVPLVHRKDVDQSVFEDVINSFFKHCSDKIREANKQEEFDLDRSYVEKHMNEIDCSDFVLKLNNEQCCSLFKSYYGFDPRRSNNNGLYVLILEVDPKNFGSDEPPVHEVDNVEMQLSKLGIRKNNPSIKLSHQVLSSNGKESIVSIGISSKELFKVKIILSPGKIVLSNS